jgi:hypothetical protein
MAYVRLADKIKQLNNANFKLVDSVDVEMDDGTDLQTTVDALKTASGSIEMMSTDDWNTFFGGLTVDVSSSN